MKLYKVLNIFYNNLMDNLILDKYRESLNVLSTEELQILEKKITIDVFNNFNNMLINANNSVDSNSQINVLKENLEKERLKNNEMKNKFSNEMTEEQNNWNEERKKIIKNHKINIDEKETEINLLEKKWRSKLEITENDNQHEINRRLSTSEDKIKFLKENYENDKKKYEDHINNLNEIIKNLQSNNNSYSNDIITEIANVKSILSQKKTNTEKGEYGENLVEKALNKNPRFADMEIEDVSGIKGNGDRVVHIPSENLDIMIEIKYENEIKTDKDLGQFNKHKETFYKENEYNGSSIFFSLNSSRIPNMFSGKFIYEGPNLNNVTSYFAKKEMNEDEIHQNFYYHIDRIIERRNNNSENNNDKSNLYTRIKQNNTLLNSQKQFHQSSIQNWKDQIYQTELHISHIDNGIKQNNELLKEEGQLLDSNKNVGFGKKIKLFVIDILNKYH